MRQAPIAKAARPLGEMLSQHIGLIPLVVLPALSPGGAAGSWRAGAVFGSAVYCLLVVTRFRQYTRVPWKLNECILVPEEGNAKQAVSGTTPTKGP